MPSYKRLRNGAPARRRRATFRKRITRKRFTRGKRGRTLPNYSFHRWVTGLNGVSVNSSTCTYDGTTSILTYTGTTESLAAMNFIFDDLPSKTEFTTLFDSYMITGVMLQIKMINNPDAVYYINSNNTSSGNQSNWYPTIWYVTDHDDSTVTSLAALKEYAKVRHKVLRPNSELNIMLRPSTLSQVYRTALTTGYAENRKRQWLDIANTDIPHYGLKFAIDYEGLAPATAYKFKINAKFYFKCRTVR